jgi:hypothetical protein
LLLDFGKAFVTIDAVYSTAINVNVNDGDLIIYKLIFPLMELE